MRVRPARFQRGGIEILTSWVWNAVRNAVSWNVTYIFCLTTARPCLYPDSSDKTPGAINLKGKNKTQEFVQVYLFGFVETPRKFIN